MSQNSAPRMFRRHCGRRSGSNRMRRGRPRSTGAVRFSCHPFMKCTTTGGAVAGAGVGADARDLVDGSCSVVGEAVRLVEACVAARLLVDLHLESCVDGHEGRVVVAVRDSWVITVGHPLLWMPEADKDSGVVVAQP